MKMFMFKLLKGIVVMKVLYTLFRCLGTQFKMKVLSGETASKVFIVTTMQTDFLGSQTSRYFGLVIAEDFNYR